MNDKDHLAGLLNKKTKKDRKKKDGKAKGTKERKQKDREVKRHILFH